MMVENQHLQENILYFQFIKPKDYTYQLINQYQLQMMQKLAKLKEILAEKEFNQTKQDLIKNSKQ